MKTGNRQRGVSAVEVLLGLAMLLALFVPVYQMFLSSREAGLRSRLAYLALQAAREEIDDLRILASLWPGKVAELKHGWRPVTGRLLARLEPLSRPGDLPSLEYPAEYGRIFTRVEVAAGDAGVFPVTVLVRWQEKGEALPTEDAREREGLSRFDLLLTPGAKK